MCRTLPADDENDTPDEESHDPAVGVGQLQWPPGNLAVERYTFVDGQAPLDTASVRNTGGSLSTEDARPIHQKIVPWVDFGGNVGCWASEISSSEFGNTILEEQDAEEAGPDRPANLARSEEFPMLAQADPEVLRDFSKLDVMLLEDELHWHCPEAILEYLDAPFRSEPFSGIAWLS